MTSPKHAKTTNRGRQYIDPHTGETYPSVTTILGQIGKADALKWWAAGEVAKYAVTMRNTWIDLDEQAAIDLLKREPLRSLSRAADRGTDVHAIADHYMQTGVIGEISQHNGYVDALINFVHDHHPQPILTEQTVYGDGYAGSFDMVCKLPALGDELTIIDYKTSKAIYPDTAAQLAAYTNAGRYIDSSDQFHLMPKIKHGAIVRLGANGEYEIQQADLDAGWRLFQAALAIHQAQQLQLLVGPLTKPDYDLKPAREHITNRVIVLRDHRPQVFDNVRANWIDGLPPLTSDKPIARHQLSILEHLIDNLDTGDDIPFDPMPKIATPPPPRKPAEPRPTPSDEIEVNPDEIETIKRAYEQQTDEVKNAIAATTAEASKARASLSLQINPTLRKLMIVRTMFEIYNDDCTDDRAYMRTLLVHIGAIRKPETTTGAALGKLNLDDLARLEATLADIRSGTLQIVYENNQYTIKKAQV